MNRTPPDMPSSPPEGHGGEARPHDAPTGEQIETVIRGIRAEAQLLDPTPTQPGTRARSAALARERSPARLDILVHLDHRDGLGLSETLDDMKAAGTTLPIRPTLRRWEHRIGRGRKLRPHNRSLAEQLVFLTAHAAWAADQPWAAEMHDQLRTLHAQLRHANGTAPPPPVGRCYLPTDDATCGGPVWVDTAAGTANCGRCHATWDGPQLAMLAYEMRKQ